MQEFTDLYQSASLNDHPGKVPVLIGNHHNHSCNHAIKYCIVDMVASASVTSLGYILNIMVQMVTLF
jgi:hypothetical protein